MKRLRFFAEQWPLAILLILFMAFLLFVLTGRVTWSGEADLQARRVAEVSKILPVSPMGENCYTVKKGDTLYEIGKKVGIPWTELTEINDLRIEWKGGVPYVWLKVGQILQLEWPTKHLDPSEIATYFSDTKAWLEKMVFKIAGIKDPIPRDDSSVFIIGFANSPGSATKLRWWIKNLDHQERWRTVDQIYDESLANIGDLPFEGSERYWEDHRKMCILLMTLLDTESDGYVVRGKGGEAGKWQIMPKTYCEYKRWPIDQAHQEIAIAVLMDDNLKGLRCVIDRLQKKKTILSALTYYNGTGEIAEAYGKRVYRKFRTNERRFK